MPSFSRHSGFAAAWMFLSACGVAVERAPQTASPRNVTDNTITETASAPEIPTSTETEISAAQAGNSADIQVVRRFQKTKSYEQGATLLDLQIQPLVQHNPLRLTVDKVF